MPDLKQKIYGLIKDYQLASLATVAEDGKPWVRYVMLEGDEELVLKFVTPLKSRKVDHIRGTQDIHILCGADGAGASKPYLQIQGRAEITRDETLRKGAWKDFLSKYFAGPDDPNYTVGIVRPYRIELYGMGMGSLQPEVWEESEE